MTSTLNRDVHTNNQKTIHTHTRCCRSSIITRTDKKFAWTEDYEIDTESSGNVSSGIFLRYREAICLVQSYQDKWGIPKGSCKDLKNETRKEGAIRETKEETGYTLDLNSTKRYIDINKYRVYEKVIQDPATISEKLSFDNIEKDISGIAWVCPECWHKLTDSRGNSGYKALNRVTKKVINRFYPKSYGMNIPEWDDHNGQGLSRNYSTGYSTSFPINYKSYYTRYPSSKLSIMSGLPKSTTLPTPQPIPWAVRRTKNEFSKYKQPRNSKRYKKSWRSGR